MDRLIELDERSFISRLFSRLLVEPRLYIQTYFILRIFQTLFFVYPSLQAGLNQIFIIWGSLIFGYHFLIKRSFKKDKGFILFFISWIMAFITIVLNREAGSFFYSIKTWYLLIIIYGVFYPFFMLSEEPREELIVKTFRPLVYLQFLIALISIGIFFGNISGFIFRPDSGFYWGLRYNFRSSGAINPLLIGLYNEPNYGGAVAFGSVIFTMLLLKQRGIKVWEKYFLWVNIFLQFYLITLANSRAVSYGLLAFILVMTVLLIRKVFLEKKGFKSLDRASILFFLILILFTFLGDNIRHYSYGFVLDKPITRITAFTRSIDNDSVPEKYKNLKKPEALIMLGYLDEEFVGRGHFLSEEVAADTELSEEEIREKIKRNKENVSEEKSDTIDSFEGRGNGRVGRWLESLKLVTWYRPLLGTSPRGIPYFAKLYSSQGEHNFWRLSAGYSPVNSYITFLLYYGWPTFLVFMFFFLKGGLSILGKIFSGKGQSYEEILMNAFLIFMLIQAFFLSAFLEVSTYYASVLALSFGYSVTMSKEEEVS